MDYALGNRLKDAGFPQKEPNGFSGIIAHAEGVADDTVYYPTLKELVEACGSEFEGLVKETGTTDWAAYRRSWLRRDDFGFSYTPFNEATPEEAVARLCLTLHANGVATA